MSIPLNLIKTRTTFYTGEDGKQRAVMMEEDYRALLAMVETRDVEVLAAAKQLTQLKQSTIAKSVWDETHRKYLETCRKLEAVTKARDEFKGLMFPRDTCSNNCQCFKCQLSATQAALKECAEALNQKVCNRPLLEYLYIEYPATQGNLPLRDFCLRQDKALSNPIIAALLKSTDTKE